MNHTTDVTCARGQTHLTAQETVSQIRMKTQNSFKKIVSSSQMPENGMEFENGQAVTVMLPDQLEDPKLICITEMVRLNE